MIMDKRLSLLVLLVLIFLIGQASAGTPYYLNGTTYPMIWNGTYASTNINYMTYWTTGYDIFWNGGLLQTVWDGTYAYDMIAYPNNGTAISPWAMWHVESYNPTNKKWGETIPISNQFIKIDNSTLKRVMVMGSGEKFNITYHNYGTRIKQDLELSNVLARQYRLTYRIDSVAAQDVNIDTKKFTPGFFNNFTLFDVTDVLPYTVNRTFNETSLLWEGDGSYLYGWNVSATIDNTNRKMYFTLTNGQVMTVGQKVDIDPSWSTNGSTTPGWQNSSYSNFALDRNTGNLILPDNVTNGLVLYHKMSGSTGTTSYDMNLILNNNGTLTNMAAGLNNGISGWNSSGKYGNAISFDGINDYVSTINNGVGNVTGSQITIMAWVYQTSNSSLAYMDSTLMREDDYSVVGLRAGQNKMTFVLKANAAQEITSGVFGLNAWHHFAGVYNGTRMVLYQNGVMVDSIANTGDLINTSQPFRIGANYVGRYFGGIIDEARVYNRALSNNEINQTINNTMKSSDNLTAWHDSGSGNEVYQIDVNATTPTNTNYTFWYRQNNTGDYAQVGGVYSGNQTIALSPKYQNTDARVVLAGNLTATPELTQITFWTQAAEAPSAEAEPAQVQVIWWD